MRALGRFTTHTVRAVSAGLSGLAFAVTIALPMGGAGSLCVAGWNLMTALGADLLEVIR